MAFPWDNLITAVSTLTAGLGGVALKQGGDRKDSAAKAAREDQAAQAERQRLADQALVAGATELLRNCRQVIGDYETYEQDYIAAIERRDGLCAQFFQAVADVEFCGSPEARESARALRAAAVTADTATRLKNVTASAVALPEFDAALGRFIDVVTAQRA